MVTMRRQGTNLGRTRCSFIQGEVPTRRWPRTAGPAPGEGDLGWCQGVFGARLRALGSVHPEDRPGLESHTPSRIQQHCLSCHCIYFYDDFT